MRLFADDAAPAGRPYWWEGEPPPATLAERPPESCDVLILGAGYTGLSAAMAAADAGARVTVCDAGRPGAGASSRNGGMVGAHPRVAQATIAARYGADTVAALFREARAAFDFTAGLIAREAIPCDFQTTGRIQLAWTRAHFEAQKRQVAAVTAVSDMAMRLVERDALGAEIATDRYFGGILFPDHAALHPRKFHDGLLAAALSRGVAVVGECAVEAVERKGASFVATLRSRRQVTADKVIVATNGYTQGRLGWFRRRVFPVPSFLIATEPLPADLLARLAPGGRMMVETRARHSYFRLSPDGTRILFGGRAAMVPVLPGRAAATLHATMTGIWPELSEVRLTHSWSGFTGFAFSHLPHVGVNEGLHFAMGYSGSGVALAPYLGMKCALQAMGDPGGETAYAYTPFPTRPFHGGGQPHFLQLVDPWFRHVVDARQDRAARRDRAS